MFSPSTDKKHAPTQDRQPRRWGAVCHSYAAIQNRIIMLQPYQARNQGDRGSESPYENFSPSLEKCVGHSLELLDIV